MNECSSHNLKLQECIKAIVKEQSLDWSEQKTRIIQIINLYLSQIDNLQYTVSIYKGLSIISYPKEIELASSDLKSEFQTLLRYIKIICSTIKYSSNIEFLSKIKKHQFYLYHPQEFVADNNPNAHSKFLEKIINSLNAAPYISLYENMLIDFVHCRIPRNRIFCIPRDKGQKWDIRQEFDYDKLGIFSFKEKYSEVHSYYKVWLIINSCGFNEDICSLIESYISTFNLPKLQRLAEVNMYECYGICMILLSLLNCVFFLKGSSELSYDITHYFIRCYMVYAGIYLKNHNNKDLLKDIDILSNYARICERFRHQCLMIFDGVLYHYPYIWAMYESFRKGMRANLPYAYHFFSCSLMMQQNGTVVMVTGDALEDNLNRCCVIGENVTNLIFKKRILYEQGMDIERKLNLQESYKFFKRDLLKKIHKDQGFNGLHLLDQICQIEPFKQGIHLCPFTKLNPDLVDFISKLNLKVDIDNLEFRETDNGRSYRIQDEICGKYIRLNQRRSDLYEIPQFFSITIEVDDEGGVVTVFIRGMHLYALKKDIDWSHLFYGYPSVVTQMMDANNLNNGLLISFFGAKDFMDTTYFDSRYK